jgi:hypothetical protein
VSNVVLTHEVITLTTLENDLRLAVHALGFNLEHKQFVECGIAIGQIRTIGEAIKNHSFVLETIISDEARRK